MLKGTNGFPEPSLLASHATEHGKFNTPPIHTSGPSIVLAPPFSVLTRFVLCLHLKMLLQHEYIKKPAFKLFSINELPY